jgi:hypothetical protein
LTTPDRPAIDDGHYPPKPAGALDRKPRARTLEERAFLALGEGAERWLISAAAAGAQRVRRKMSDAIDLAKLHGQDQVEQALAACAQAGRFADGDLQAILAHHHQQQAAVIPLPLKASEASSLQPSTRSWEGFGTMNPPIDAHTSQPDAPRGDLRPSEPSPRPIP